MPIVNGEYRRPQLRNGKINYRFGWFFVTFQVFENKSELGAIVGECCVLNVLGEAMKNLIETLPKFNHEVFVDAFVVMPNHVHVIIILENQEKIIAELNKEENESKLRSEVLYLYFRL